MLATRANHYRLAWSPDGREVSFSACCQAERTRLYVVHADGGAPRIVAEAGASAWSPDGRLAFVGFVFGNPTLFVTDRNGASPRLVAGSVAGPTIAWSPDSRHIAYERGRTESRGVDVAVVSAEGGTPVLVVPGHDPEWSPDGRHLAFSSEGIKTVDVRSGQVRTLAPGERLVKGGARWSPDGARLVFVSAASPEPPAEVGAHLEVVRADGSERTRITPESPLAVPTVVPAASVTPPDQLTIPIVVDTPDAVRPGGVVTARATVQTAMLGDFVDGAHVSVSASPGTMTRVTPRVAHGRGPRDHTHPIAQCPA